MKARNSRSGNSHVRKMGETGTTRDSRHGEELVSGCLAADGKLKIKIPRQEHVPWGMMFTTA